ncbi:MAG: hypothetical protein S0880_26755 [Actinomycetota bacterium]|nr:hypothetical protein [Actinomycetota bacterium]
MTWLALVKAELRKLRTTRMPWAFAVVLAVIAVVNGIAVVAGTDMDGSKAFIATAADQQSMMAFAANALMIAGLFGAVVTAREYGHGTVVPMYLAEPRRVRAASAQLAATAVGGAVLGLLGAAMTIVAMAVTLPTTDYGFLVSAGGVTRVLAAAAFSGAAGAVLGAGLGVIVRNTGGAVTGAVLVLVVAPPLLVQLASDTASWVPSTLANVVSGVTSEVGVVAALGAIAAWAVVPAIVGLWTIERRDVV